MPQITKDEILKEFKEKWYTPDWKYTNDEDEIDFMTWFYSKLTQSQEEARRRERKQVEKEIIGCMPLIAPKKTMDTVKVFLEIIKPVFSLAKTEGD